jgi:hypothetical protein
MNNYKDDNRRLSSRCHIRVNNIVVSDRKREFMAGTYVCAGDDGRNIELNGF